MNKHPYFVLGEEFSVRVLLEKVCKSRMTHLAECSWSLHVAFLAAASLAEKLVVGHKWYISPAINNSLFEINSQNTHSLRSSIYIPYTECYKYFHYLKQTES